MFPDYLKEVPPFPKWIRNSITIIVKKGDKIEKDVVHVSMPPTLEAKNYRVMWVFSNHIRVLGAREHLIMHDNGVTTIFEHECVSRLNYHRLVVAKLECVGWVEEILELNFWVLSLVILFCNWVKSITLGIVQR